VPVFDLVTAGDAFEDLVFAGLPRLPRVGEEIRTKQFARTAGGGALITAVAAARSGLRCRVISALHPAAAALLIGEGIAVTNLRRPHEEPAISAALSTPHNRTFVTFTGVNDRLESRLFAPLRRVAARHVHFAFCPSRCVRWRPVLASLRRRRITTSWDFGWNERLLGDPGFLPLVDALDYFLLNEQEAALYARKPRLSSAFAFWKRRTGCTVVKLGRRGSCWLSPDLDITIPARAVRVVDTTGAGDAFNGGFLAARLRGAPPGKALQAGNRLGARSARRAGGVDALRRDRGRR
jgi:sugar/nucleoside kinase (ribokinase family)